MFGYDPINERIALDSVSRDTLPSWARAERMEHSSDFMDALYGVFSKKKSKKTMR